MCGPLARSAAKTRHRAAQPAGRVTRVSAPARDEPASAHHSPGHDVVDEGTVAAHRQPVRATTWARSMQPPGRARGDQDGRRPRLVGSRDGGRGCAPRPLPSVRSRVPSRSVATAAGRPPRHSREPVRPAGSTSRGCPRRGRTGCPAAVRIVWVTSPIVGATAAVVDRAAVPAQFADRGDDRGGAAGEDLGDLTGAGPVLPLLDGDAPLLGLQAELLGELQDRARVTPSRMLPVSSGVTSRPSLVTKKRFIPPSSSMYSWVPSRGRPPGRSRARCPRAGRPG
jgi:hypothetical protein